MNKNRIRFFTLGLIIFTNFLFAQQRNLWNKLDEVGSNKELAEKTNLTKYEAYELEVSALRKELINAPKRNEISSRSAVKMKFPDADGKMITFLVKEASVMAPELEKKYPMNKSYIGISEKDGSKKIRFSLNELGLNAIVSDINGDYQVIDPLSKNKSRYKVYRRDNMQMKREFQCLTEDNNLELKSTNAYKIVDDGVLRIYRFALAANGEYSQYHIADQNAENTSDAFKKALVLSTLTTATTRISAVYENDLGISLQLVGNNDDLIYLDPDTDPYSNTGREMIGENQANCDAVIGDANYDVGHVFGTGVISVASLGVACLNGQKARGATGSPIPAGDNFYFDFMAHELGHQFGATHSFNGDEGSCGMDGQRNEEFAVEPGSGSTIMAYAGVCESQNVQSNSDFYFHTVSMEQIRTFVTSGTGANCAQEIDLKINNNAPSADAGRDFTIPIGTAYKLIGSGDDADGDLITFVWEQADNGITVVPPSPNSKTGALYRSVNPSTSEIRYMPDLNTLVTGVVSSTWEMTPLVSRELNFTLTVRDNNLEGGQVSNDDLKVTVTEAAGPFLVTSQATEDVVWTPNSNETITWDVAGTTGNGINVSSVNILLSTDGGKTFPTVLAKEVTNDGSQIIAVPDMKASKCFVMVEAEGHFFLALNSKSFSIGEFNQICTNFVAEDTPLTIPDGDTAGMTSTVFVSDDVDIESIEVRIIDESDETDVKPGIRHTWVGDLVITLESPEGTEIELFSRACSNNDDIQAVFSDEGDVIECSNSSPAVSGTIKPLHALTAFNGENAQGNWTLKIIDNENVDSGTLEGWSLDICSSEAVLGVNNYVFQDFKVFPNPTDGNFTIKFQSEETGDVDVLVYDLLGRKVAQKTYRNLSSQFEEQMDLGRVSSGLYMLSVKRGNKISAHKIRVK